MRLDLSAASVRVEAYATRPGPRREGQLGRPGRHTDEGEAEAGGAGVELRIEVEAQGNGFESPEVINHVGLDK